MELLYTGIKCCRKKMLQMLQIFLLLEFDVEKDHILTSFYDDKNSCGTKSCKSCKKKSQHFLHTTFHLCNMLCLDKVFCYFSTK